MIPAPLLPLSMTLLLAKAPALLPVWCCQTASLPQHLTLDNAAAAVGMQGESAILAAAIMAMLLAAF